MKITLPKDSYLHLKRNNCSNIFYNDDESIECKNHPQIKEKIIRYPSHDFFTTFNLNITVYNTSYKQKIIINKNEKKLWSNFHTGAKNDKEF